MGREGSFKPMRARFRAADTDLTASSWPITCFCSAKIIHTLQPVSALPQHCHH